MLATIKLEQSRPRETKVHHKRKKMFLIHAPQFTHQKRGVLSMSQANNIFDADYPVLQLQQITQQMQLSLAPCFNDTVTRVKGIW